ncbi:MAG TPA: ferritin-like domain-containing protein [Methylibium sp.]|uniref:ferritin-like domain-containing protein n=1 Tax=Methylibium sp. TaxID=2067992 RepID=UPI002DBF4618|nr:ferritin-like domain-containing protein [Methylibium sp.]HEU4460249.1 ferritin-like domain-containing protein [Methylibium sp.]
MSPAAAFAPTELRRGALACLEIAEPEAKLAAVQALAHAARYRKAPLPIDPAVRLEPARALPGRPAKPELVPVRSLAQRSVHTRPGRAALLHAIAHIEFNAINLALDAIWRFAGMPPAYYKGWLLVADEEAQHFALLVEHLRTLGHRYGDFPAHDGLWSMVERTAGDVLARMALVPRTLEARGLDATPPLQAKLREAGDERAAEILGVILRDEVGHVSIGNHWYRWLCKRAKLDPVATYAELAERHDAPKPRPPLNLDARAAAGFTAAELDALKR